MPSGWDTTLRISTKHWMSLNERKTVLILQQRFWDLSVNKDQMWRTRSSFQPSCPTGEDLLSVGLKHNISVIFFLDITRDRVHYFDKKVAQSSKCLSSDDHVFQDHKVADALLKGWTSQKIQLWVLMSPGFKNQQPVVLQEIFYSSPLIPSYVIETSYKRVFYTSVCVTPAVTLTMVLKCVHALLHLLQWYYFWRIGMTYLRRGTKSRQRETQASS